MPFIMGFSKETLSGGAPLPPGWYQLRLIGFKPKFAADKESVNLNAEFRVVGGEHDDTRIIENMNTKGWWAIQDMVHATGQTLVEAQDGNQGTEAARFVIPGIWDKAEQFPEEPERWEYLGPLTNAMFTAETYQRDYNGKKYPSIRQYKCVVPGCQERHSTNLGR